jgi:hypothetical protein
METVEKENRHPYLGVLRYNLRSDVFWFNYYEEINEM